MTTQLERARGLARSGDYRQAAMAFRRYLDETQDRSVQVQLELGYALLLAGDTTGARRIYDALVDVVAAMTELPERLLELWRRFAALVAETPRRVVVTGMAAALVAGCTPSGGGTVEQPKPVPPPSVSAAPTVAPIQPTFSSHRYSGGVALDQLQLQKQLDKLENDAQKPTAEPTFSSHRYSGGVNIQHDLDRMRPSSDDEN